MWGEGMWREKRRRRESLTSEPSWTTKRDSLPCPSLCQHQTPLNSPKGFHPGSRMEGQRSYGE